MLESAFPLKSLTPVSNPNLQVNPNSSIITYSINPTRVVFTLVDVEVNEPCIDVSD